jgi:hypothetical protein
LSARPLQTEHDAPPLHARRLPREARATAAGHLLAELAELTEDHRETIAQRHDRAATAAAAAAVRAAPWTEADLPDPYHPDDIAPPWLGPWYTSPAGRAAFEAARLLRLEDNALVTPGGRRCIVSRRRRRRGEAKARRIWVPATAADASAARWHEGRARGQRERFMSLAHCGVGRVRITCRKCGKSHETPQHCGVNRLCAGCQARRTQRRRARFLRARQELIRTKRPQHWTEKHITITIPHRTIGTDAETVRDRVETLFRVWRRWTLSLQAHIRRTVPERHRRQVSWYRVFEWTPGADMLGHPHAHAWFLGPWIPIEDWARGPRGRAIQLAEPASMAPTSRPPPRLETAPRLRLRRTGISPGVAANDGGTRHKVHPGARSWLRSALAAEGINEQTPRLQIAGLELAAADHMREIIKHDGTKLTVRDTRIRATTTARARALAQYFEPWSIVAVADSGRVPETTIAELYKALEGHRLSQGSSGFLARAKREPMECPCGSRAHAFETISWRATYDPPPRPHHTSTIPTELPRPPPPPPPPTTWTEIMQQRAAETAAARESIRWHQDLDLRLWNARTMAAADRWRGMSGASDRRP